jgi:hypothetical protein
MIHSLARVSNKIIKVRFSYVLKIMKRESHGTLKGCSDILRPKGIFQVCKRSPRTNKFHLLLVFVFYLNLIISRKFVHKRKHFASDTLVENLIDERCGEVVFRIGHVLVTEIHGYTDGSLLLIYRNEVVYPFG